MVSLAELPAGLQPGTLADSQTVPEAKPTLVAQQRQLMQGQRPAQMFPLGTPELPLPPGMKRVVTPKGVFHFDPLKVTAEAIRRAVALGHENEVLNLGAVSKNEAAVRTLGVEIPTTVVERQPDGTEVRAAAGTHATAPQQMIDMLRNKSSGSSLSVENPNQTIVQRLMNR